MLKLLKTASVLVLVLMLMKMPVQPAQAATTDDSAGTVLAARRVAWSDRYAAELKSKNQVYNGDLLSTNNVGRLQVLFRDDSILMMAPDTQTRITEYLWDGGTQASIGMDLARGVTRVISGQVTENGGTINITTPEAEIGIRGTDVLIRSTPDGTTEVAVIQGDPLKPTNVCLPGAGSDAMQDCIPLGPQQGALISDNSLLPMDDSQYNNFTNNDLNDGGGVTPPDDTLDGPGYAALPGDLPTDLPINPLPETPGNLPKDDNINISVTVANYGGVWSNADGYGSTYNPIGSYEGGFKYSVRDLVNDPTISSVDFYARVNGDYFGMSGQGDLAKLDSDGNWNLSSEDNPNITLDTPSGLGSAPVGTINGGSNNVDWMILDSEENGVVLSGTPQEDYTPPPLPPM